MNNKINILTNIKQNIADKLELIGELIEAEAKLRCPVGQYPEGSGKVGGRLRGSITHQVIDSGSAVRIGTPVEYAPYVEFGTYKMSAQPFMRPAVLDNIPRITRLLST